MPKKKVEKQLDSKSKEVSDATVERLKRVGFQKGKSGNPMGRTPGSVSLSTEIKRIANQTCDKTGLSYLHTLILTMFVEAIEGDQETRQILFDRGFGTLIQKNILMQLGGDILKLAQGLGLDASDLAGSTTVRGLLETTGFEFAGADGTQAPGSGETRAAEATVIESHQAAND